MKHIKLKNLIITQNVEEIKLGGGGVLGEYLFKMFDQILFGLILR